MVLMQVFVLLWPITCLLLAWNIYDNAKDMASKKGSKPKFEVSVMRVTSVQADPGRSDVFRISYVDKARLQQHLVLRRVDRSRDSWIELLQELIKTARQRKEDGGEDDRDSSSFHKDDNDNGKDRSKKAKKAKEANPVKKAKQTKRSLIGARRSVQKTIKRSETRMTRSRSWK